SAPNDSAWSRKALNLISLLHMTSGLGVLPALYSSKKYVNTLSQYSFANMTEQNRISNSFDTRTTSSKSSVAVHTPNPSVSSQSFIKIPTTSYPCSLRSKAVTEESTPPLIP